jgi:hypothetical protein
MFCIWERMVLNCATNVLTSASVCPEPLAILLPSNSTAQNSDREEKKDEEIL